MNYLAHAYLSFGNDELIIGNMISDFVKGKKQYDYPKGIQKGIALHRAIDNFTDTHEATKKAKEFFRPYYRLYSGAFVDVVYDHFLANDENEFTESSLLTFSEKIYDVLGQHLNQLPRQFAYMFPYMRNQNWLFNYRTKWGTEKSFGGIVHRSFYLTESATASTVFEKFYLSFKECYRSFFPELKKFAKNKFSEISAEE